ncbi:MAG: hypothetical protein O9284_04645 [Steroidobacteraceae bacterium]|jgi:hypothetical protein|nr:hypothetical protein [Steroidobacteraceae bacterium]
MRLVPVLPELVGLPPSAARHWKRLGLLCCQVESAGVVADLDALRRANLADLVSPAWAGAVDCDSLRRFVLGHAAYAGQLDEQAGLYPAFAFRPIPAVLDLEAPCAA